MSAVHDLLSQINDEALRNRLETEYNKLSKNKKFGLVFEEHLPECTPLYDVPIKKGSSVARRSGPINEIFEIVEIKDTVACCIHKTTKTLEHISLDDLVCVAEFGEPIYPYLKPLDSICNAPESDLWHTLIEADNYHALQLLEYLYAGKVDCIYIDPPYNTGAKDWKYNNNYVDSNDSYRHSKWLSMMKKRLCLAKKLLNPQDSVLIVTIDEKEYLHLGCLLEELFPEAKIQMVSSVINAGGSIRSGEFSRTDEYIFFIKIGSAHVLPLALGSEWRGGKQENHGPVLWRSMLRGGEASSRGDRPNMFYPVIANTKTRVISKIGDAIPVDASRDEYTVPDGYVAVWPIRKDGSEGRWRVGVETARENLSKGYIKINQQGNRYTVSYLAAGVVESIEKGSIKVSGKGRDLQFNVLDEHKIIPGTAWQIASHDASKNGTAIIKSILGSRSFAFPKSLYAVHDAIRFFVSNKPDALIIDFFAGSGTTLHAVNLLNAEDKGHRRCILVTNNEVSDAEAKRLLQRGVYPGDEEWEQLGIARYITWPRTVCSIEGHDISGEPLKGNYLGSDIPMLKGFETNAVFFKLGFLDKTAVALGKQLEKLIPVLWMKSGSHNAYPEHIEISDPMILLPNNRFAILTNENYYRDFVAEVQKHPEIKTIYIVTDSEAGYREMISEFSDKDTYQLYRDYLDNFRINTGR